MNIATLEVIHKLLQLEVERTKEVAVSSRCRLRSYETDSPVPSLIEDQKAIVATDDKEASRVADALKDFETTDWS